MNKNENESNSLMHTSDLPLIVTLVSLGFHFKSFDKSNSSRVVFSFQQTPNLQEVVEKFWQGKLAIEPKMFWNTQRELKAQIRNEIGVY